MDKLHGNDVLVTITIIFDICGYSYPQRRRSVCTIEYNTVYI